MAKDLALLPTNKISTAVNLLSPPIMAELKTDVDRMVIPLSRRAMCVELNLSVCPCARM
jgi:hypothetical protein